jgi:hypothetical protein
MIIQLNSSKKTKKHINKNGATKDLKTVSQSTTNFNKYNDYILLYYFQIITIVSYRHAY